MYSSFKHFVKHTYTAVSSLTILSRIKLRWKLKNRHNCKMSLVWEASLVVKPYQCCIFTLSAPHLLVDLNIIGRFTQHLLVDLKTFDRFSNLHLLAGLKKKSNNKSTAIVPLKLSKPYIFTLFFKLKLFSEAKYILISYTEIRSRARKIKFDLSPETS